MEDVLKNGYYASPLGYDIVDRFVDEVLKIADKMSFYFKNTHKDIIMTPEDKEDYRNNDFCGFCEKKRIDDKVR